MRWDGLVNGGQSWRFERSGCGGWPAACVSVVCGCLVCSSNLQACAGEGEGLDCVWSVFLDANCGAVRRTDGKRQARARVGVKGRTGQGTRVLLTAGH